MDNNINNTPESLADIFFQGLPSGEKDKLKDWINQKNENRKIYNEFRDIWQATAMVRPENDYDENAAWDKLKTELKVTKPKRNLSWLKYAAVALIFGVLGSLTYYLFTPQKTKIPLSYQEIYVPYGSTSKIVLPDGSNVWLNAGSYLRYNNSFNINNRKLLLKGEAFFEVQKNKKIEFIVQTPGMEVKAIGTKFNIKSYPEEKIISATVVEGKVQVINNLKADKPGEIILTANQTASYIKEFTAPPVVEPEKDKNQKLTEELDEIPSKIADVNSEVNTDILVSWHEGKLIIERETLGSLAPKLERRYNIKMQFVDSAVKNYVFSGVLKDETFEQVMEVIRLTSPLHFSVNGNFVKLTEDKSLKNRLK